MCIGSEPSYGQTVLVIGILSLIVTVAAIVALRFRPIPKREKQLHGILTKLIIIFVAVTILGVIWMFFDAMFAPMCLGCVTNPLDNIASTIKYAQGGLEASTSTICLTSGEAFSSQMIKERLNNLETVTFQCYQSDYICSGSRASLDVKNDSITAKSDVQFKALISCEPSQTSGPHTCTLRIKQVIL